MAEQWWQALVKKRNVLSGTKQEIVESHYNPSPEERKYIVKLFFLSRTVKYTYWLPYATRQYMPDECLIRRFRHINSITWYTDIKGNNKIICRHKKTIILGLF